MADMYTYLWWTLFAVGTYLLARGIRWFLDPYFIYRNRKMDKDLEFYIQGKKQTKQQIGLPFLLRPIDLEQRSADTIRP